MPIEEREAVFIMVPGDKWVDGVRSFLIGDQELKRVLAQVPRSTGGNIWRAALAKWDSPTQRFAELGRCDHRHNGEKAAVAICPARLQAPTVKIGILAD